MKIEEKSMEPSPSMSNSSNNGTERSTVIKSRRNGYSLRSRPAKSNKSKAKSGDVTSQANHSRQPQGTDGSSTSKRVPRSRSRRTAQAQSHNNTNSASTADLKSTLDAQCEDIAFGNKETDSAIHFLVSLLDLLEKEEHKSVDASNRSLEMCESPSENGIKQEAVEELDPNVIVHSYNGCEEDMSTTRDIEQRFSSINIVESQSHESTKTNISVKNEHESMVNGLGYDESKLSSDVQMNGNKPIEAKKKLSILEHRLLGLPVDQLSNSAKPATHSPVQDMGMMLKAQMKAAKQFFVECIKKDDPEYGNKLEQLEDLKESNSKLEALVQSRVQKLSSLRTFHAGLQNEAFQHHTG